MKHDYFIRAPGNYDVDEASNESAISEFLPSLTIQSEKDDADINVILKRFGVLGQLPQDVRVPLVGDFSNVTDYQSALHLIMEADASFMQMPADVRARFDNDANLFVHFASDPANIDAMREMGLAIPAAVAASTEVKSDDKPA